MKILSIEEFNEYCPIINDKRIYPVKEIDKALDKSVVWNLFDYAMLANHIFNRTLWTVIKDSDHYKIIPGGNLSYINGLPIIGYVIMEKSYGRGFVGTAECRINF